MLTVEEQIQAGQQLKYRLRSAAKKSLQHGPLGVPSRPECPSTAITSSYQTDKDAGVLAKCLAAWETLPKNSRYAQTRRQLLMKAIELIQKGNLAAR